MLSWAGRPLLIAFFRSNPSSLSIGRCSRGSAGHELPGSDVDCRLIESLRYKESLQRSEWLSWLELTIAYMHTWREDRHHRGHRTWISRHRVPQLPLTPGDVRSLVTSFKTLLHPVLRELEWPDAPPRLQQRHAALRVSLPLSAWRLGFAGQGREHDSPLVAPGLHYAQRFGASPCLAPPQGSSLPPHPQEEAIGH